MSTPVTTYPPLEMRSQIANPIVTGTLYTAATVVELPTPARIEGGARIEQTNAGDGWGTWTLDCPSNLSAADFDGTRWGALQFPAFGVGATDECSLVGTTETEVSDLAAQRLRITEEVAVSSAFAETLLDAGGDPDEAPADVVATVGAIEEVLGSTGIRGVVHAARRNIALLASKSMIVRGNAGRLETPGGHAWAFGTGYDNLGKSLVATGPVTIYRTPVVITPSVHHGQNRRSALAEREVLPTYELFAATFEIGA